MEKSMKKRTLGLSVTLNVVLAVILAGAIGLADEPKGKILEQTTLAAVDHYHYNGWPTIAQTADGELLTVVSGGREGHVCPFGRVDFYRSKDGGKTWSDCRTILDHP